MKYMLKPFPQGVSGLNLNKTTDWNKELRQFMRKTQTEISEAMALPPDMLKPRAPNPNDKFDALACLLSQMEMWVHPGCIYIKEEWDS